MLKYPQRKNIRLEDYDYSQAGYYFITICTNNRLSLLSNITDGDLYSYPLLELTWIGNEIIEALDFISRHNQSITIDKYVIMPNHIHLIIILQAEEIQNKIVPVNKIIGQLKSYTNKRYNDINKKTNQILWQRNYYEHIIRNEKEYEKICEYIETNPLKWAEDEYYI